MILDTHMLIKYMDKWRSMSDYTMSSQMAPLMSITLLAVPPSNIARLIYMIIFSVFLIASRKIKMSYHDMLSTS